MLQFLLHKLLRIAVTLLGVTLIVFLMVHAIPGNPWSNYSTQARQMVGAEVDQSIQRELNRRFGLDLPLWRQYTRYVIGDRDSDGQFICGVVCGNLGPSIRQRGRTVEQVLFAAPEGGNFWRSRFGYSIRLVLLAALLAVLLGVPIGILSATRRHASLGKGISVGLAALISIPNFVLGLLAIVFFASGLRIMRVVPDWGNPASWIVPALVLAVAPMASIARVTRTSLIHVIHEDYVRTAVSKGLPPRQVLRNHVVRNALVPVITFTGPLLVEMLAALLVVENLYGFPGFGKDYWEAVVALDYPMVMAVTLLYAGAIIVINIGIETVCGVLDPRLRTEADGGAP